jgi:hypothetical protein
MNDIYEYEEEPSTKKKVAISQTVVSSNARASIVDIDGVKYELVKLGFVEELEEEIKTLKNNLRSTTSKVNALIRAVNNMRNDADREKAKRRF